MKKGTCSRTLFVTKDGRPMRFYVRPGPLKRKLSPLIVEGGGVVCHIQEPGAFLLADPIEQCVAPGYVSTAYITDCVSSNRSLSPRAYRLLPPWNRSKNRVKDKSPLFTKSPTKESPGKGNRDHPTSTVTHPRAEPDEPENRIEQIENSGTKINYEKDDKINMSPAGRAGMKQTVQVCNDVPNNNTSEEVARGLVEGHKKIVHAAAVHSTSADEPSGQEGGQQHPPASSKTAVEQELSGEVVPDTVNDLEAGTDHESNLVIDEESLFKMEYMRPKRKLRTDRHRSCEGIQQKTNAKQRKVVSQADVHEIPRDAVQNTAQNISHSSEAQVDVEERIEKTAEAESSALENSTAKKSDKWPTEKQGELDTSLVTADSSPALKQGRMFFTEEEDIAIMQYVRDNVSSKRTVTGTLLWKDMETRKVLNRTWQSIKARYVNFLVNQKYKLQHARLSLDNKDSVKIPRDVVQTTAQNLSHSSGEQVDVEERIEETAEAESSALENSTAKKSDNRPTEKQGEPVTSLVSANSAPALKWGKMPFTEEEDIVILQYVKDNVSSKRTATGILLWKDMEARKVLNRTWKSMRARYFNFLVNQNYKLQHARLSLDNKDSVKTPRDVVQTTAQNISHSSKAQVLEERIEETAGAESRALENSTAKNSDKRPTEKQAEPATSLVSAKSSPALKQGKVPFTEEEDIASLQYTRNNIASKRTVTGTLLQNSPHSSEEQVDIEERIEETAEAERSPLENTTAKKSDNRPTEKQAESGTTLVSANSSPALKRRRMFFTEEEDITILQYVRDNVSSKRTVSGSLLWKDMETRKVLNRNWQVIKAYYFKYLVNKKSKHIHARLSLDNKSPVKTPRDDVQTTAQNISHSSEAQVDIEERIEETAEAESSALEHSTAKKSDNRPTDKQAESDTSLVSDDSSAAPKRGKMPFTEEEDIAILQYIRDNVSSKRTVTGTLLWKDMETRKVLNRSWQSMRGRYVKYLVNQKHKLQDARLSLDNKGSVKIEDSKLEFANVTCSTPLFNADPQKSSTDSNRSPEASQRSCDRQPGVSMNSPQGHNGTQHVSSPQTPQRHNTIQHSCSGVTPRGLNTTPCGSSSEAIKKHIVTPHCSPTETQQEFNTKHGSETPQRPNTTEHSSLVELPLRHSPTRPGSSVEASQIPSPTQLSTLAQDPQRPNTIPPETSQSSTALHDSLADTPQRHLMRRHGATAESPHKSDIAQHGYSLETSQKCNGIPPTDSTQTPQICETTEIGTSGDTPQKCVRTKHGDGMLTFSPPAKSPFPDRETSSDLDDLHIFEIANMEFEIDDIADSGEEAPMADSPEEPAGTSSAPSADEPSTASEASDHNGLQKAITDMMGEFKLTMYCVMQALYFNNGELGSTRHFLRTGARPDGYPIWEPQDDLDLKRNDPSTQTHLVEKYGANNVAKRLAFLSS
ncbi:biorientation of chromosomes in cell division protein 1-like 1 [Hyperolius riggenbachi]|uniref:biorientation of chromosomes in cell division protein 1-like 1 n=1 Tax=Hyperolius riggenbachi TaxID=752182 RepID=UPI0035A3061B